MLLEIPALMDDKRKLQNSSLLLLPTLADFSILKQASPDPHASV